MPRIARLTHQFVDHAPERLEEGIFYISIPFTSALHLCCCGCGREVVTPLTPHDWRMIFDGETVSLEPSIGNWSFPCRSHYWIRRNTVRWVPYEPRDHTDRDQTSTNPPPSAASKSVPGYGWLRRLANKIMF